MSSLKCWLRKIEKQDKISKEDLSEILNLLDGHDKAIRADERAKTIDEFYNRLLNYKSEINTANYPWNYIELVAREMKGGKKNDNRKTN